MQKRKWMVVKPALGIVAAGLFCLSMIFPQSAIAAERGVKTAHSTQIEHGKYIVNDLAGCADCHTPMNQRGEPVPGKYLRGAKLPFGPLVPVPNWAASSADIAGLDGWTTQQAVHFLMTGLDRSGHHADPPMPQYRMNRTDATAVVAYLKSVK